MIVLDACPPSHYSTRLGTRAGNNRMEWTMHVIDRPVGRTGRQSAAMLLSDDQLVLD